MRIQERIALALGSAGLGVLAFPPIGWWPLALVAWALLLWGLRGAGARAGFYLGLLHGVLFYGASLSWLWNLFQQFAVMLWLILAAFTAVAGAVAGGVSRSYPRAVWLPWFVAAGFAALGFVRGEVYFLRFPWMTPGLALGPTWISPWIGVYGAGFLVLLAGSLVVFGGRRSQGFGMALTAVLAGLAVFRPSPVIEAGQGVAVLAIQSEACDFETYRQMTAAEDFFGGIILWPEYAAPALRVMPTDLAAAMALTNEREAVLVLGTNFPLPNDRHHNEALTLEAGEERGSHFKNHTVHFFNDGVAGVEAVPVATRFGALGTPICFDCDYSDTVRRMTAAGASMFAVPSMDAAHWSARQHLQHAELFRHRALENGRWMAVCATSGVTQVIDPHGNRVASLPILEDGVLRGTVFPRERLTFYTKTGWRFPWLVLTVWSVGCFALAACSLFGKCPRQPAK